jgi:hypothetical protein
MRTCDLDTSGSVWEYVPERHKTASHGERRRIFLGPKAQEVVRQWLRVNRMEYLFQPREAIEEFHAGRKRNRKTPLTPSQRSRTRKAGPVQAPGERYYSRSYAHAVTKACRRAGGTALAPPPTTAQLSDVAEEGIRVGRGEDHPWAFESGGHGDLCRDRSGEGSGSR